MKLQHHAEDIQVTPPKSRHKEIVKIIEKNGGKFSSNLTQKTDVLIYGENTSSKMDKAKKFNIKMIEFNEFIKEVNKNGII